VIGLGGRPAPAQSYCSASRVEWRLALKRRTHHCCVALHSRDGLDGG
jgi:hypothetical protein